MFRTMMTLAALAAGSTIPLAAQGWIDVERRPTTPNVSPVVRTGSQVRITIDGRIARVEVEERFRNTGGGIAEGTYLYPMPGEAVFTDFSLWMGEQEVRGEMMNADQARGIYEAIVRRLRDPALLTLEGHGLIRARVFPIQPGETRKVVLRYTQLLARAGDALRLQYAIGDREPERERGRGDVRPAGNLDFQVRLPGSGFGTPYSPTHRIESRTVNGRTVISLEPDATGDVELFLPLRQGLVGTSLVAHAPAGEDGYFMLLLAPPTAPEGELVPRDLFLVVDVSGSMSGDKIEQARAAIEQALGTLRPADRFRLIAFSSRVRGFRPDLVPATPANLSAAREFAAGLIANGGTNIEAALNAVLTPATDPERLSIILFLTDGLPSIGEQAPDRLAEGAASRIGSRRIFTFGVGHDVNTYLLDRLAREGRGSAQYVAPNSSVEEAVSAVVSKIQHPALVNLRIARSPVTLDQAMPAELPDLFYGEELVVFGRYRGTGRGPLVIEGERNGHRERFTVDAEFPGTEAGNDFIPRLWAARRIGDLTRQIRLEGATPALIEQVRDLGLRYGILTEYTSYLVQEPTAERPMLSAREEAARARSVAAAPAAQTGARYFEQADASAKMSASGSLAEADRAAGQGLRALRGDAARIRRVGVKLFRQQAQAWVDVSHGDSLPVTTVAPYSEAYFALVRALPELAEYLALGDTITIAGRRASITIAGDGITQWSPGALARLVRAYRGS